MATITIPSAVLFESAKMMLSRNTTVHRSPWTGKRYTLARSASYWTIEARLTKRDGAEAGALRSFLVAAKGRENTFSVPLTLVGYTAPASGYAGTTGQVKGAGQTGSSLLTDNWTPSTLVLKAGDYFEVGGEVKMVTADITSDGLGDATVTFEPALRTAPADNASLDYNTPSITMAMQDDDIPWAISAPVIHQADVKFEEAY